MENLFDQELDLLPQFDTPLHTPLQTRKIHYPDETLVAYPSNISQAQLTLQKSKEPLLPQISRNTLHRSIGQLHYHLQSLQSTAEKRKQLLHRAKLSTILSLSYQPAVLPPHIIHLYTTLLNIFQVKTDPHALNLWYRPLLLMSSKLSHQPVPCLTNG